MLAQGDRLTGYRCNALRLLAPYVKKKLAMLQKRLDEYAKMLADIAKVEDLTVLEKT
ncbi:MAG: hypothetical protein KDJ99_31785 [Candidatus Competibacteraceae bacterium]|nr:hypothetical protein [Candidatus Competibacteraceae bacterium]